MSAPQHSLHSAACSSSRQKVCLSARSSDGLGVPPSTWRAQLARSSTLTGDSAPCTASSAAGSSATPAAVPPSSGAMCPKVIAL